MREALAAWWADSDDAPAARHTYLPCELRRRRRANGNGSAVPSSALAAPAGDGAPPLANHACNPSCDKYRMKRRLSQECPCSPT